ncbi:LysR substrate-binding domain-containing protein [Flavimaricola marinus]|uniref:FMN reductase (NADH) RutF n=1 Tax=Flavimaricola marinus TaxID=1819565 RepID=A0A238LD35_9RHOB|nr:LysR substrate-binding domain-containing protein [Flavimaricola marinus]SMY07538.1 FMN reductase (NADH) RutF [Flavimaricola marinus]
MAETPTLRDRFLAGMSYAAATVNVVTTDGPAGRAGVTVSAMSSVSADTPKPTLLVCVHHLSPAADTIIQNGVFCVNVLRDDQSYISDTFAGRFREDVADKFDCAKWATMTTGAPRVVDPLVAFDCRIVSAERVGTHHVFIGEVVDLFVAPRGSALIYANRAYGRPSPIAPVASLRAGQEAQGTALRIGCFHTFGPFLLPAMIASLAKSRSLSVDLVEGDQRRLLESLKAGEVDLALMYDFDMGEEIDTALLRELSPYVLLSPDHPLAGQADISLAELRAHPMVLLESPPSSAYFLSLFEGTEGPPEVAYKSASFEMVRGLVGQGLGFALLATRPAADVSYDGHPLLTKPLRDKVPPSRIVLASIAGKTLPKSAEAFSFLCRELFEHEL